MSSEIFLTIVTSAITSIFAFYFYNFYAIKLLKWHKLKEELVVITVQYANWFTYFVEKDGKRDIFKENEYNELYSLLRHTAGEVTTLNDVKLYEFWVKIGLLPSKKIIEEISGDLIGWGNSLVLNSSNNSDFPTNREVRLERVKKNLGIQNEYDTLREMQKENWTNARKK